MKLNNPSIVVIFLFITGIVMTSIIMVLAEKNFPRSPDFDLTNEKCCGGCYCTDTRYNPEENVCELTLCYGRKSIRYFLWWGEETNCTYPPDTRICSFKD